MSAWGNPKTVVELVAAFRERGHWAVARENGNVLDVWGPGVATRRAAAKRPPAVVVAVPDEVTCPRYLFVDAGMLGVDDPRSVTQADWPAYPYVAELGAADEVAAEVLAVMPAATPAARVAS